MKKDAASKGVLSPFNAASFMSTPAPYSSLVRKQ